MTGSDRKWAKVPAPGSGRALCGPAERMGPQGREGEPGGCRRAPPGPQLGERGRAPGPGSVQQGDTGEVVVATGSDPEAPGARLPGAPGTRRGAEWGGGRGGPLTSPHWRRRAHGRATPRAHVGGAAVASGAVSHRPTAERSSPPTSHTALVQDDPSEQSRGSNPDPGVTPPDTVAHSSPTTPSPTRTQFQNIPSLPPFRTHTLPLSLYTWVPTHSGPQPRVGTYVVAVAVSKWPQ